MLQRLVHRGPDDEGLHIETNLMLGARRLAVIDPEGGHQPISNETGTVWVVLNGEIYNHRELREELMQKGHRFTTRCDTEVLVHLYEEEGIDGVHRLRGMFAYGLWDRERGRLLLVRDRLGIKPLYYSRRALQDGHAGLVFASELPALMAAIGRPRVRLSAVAEYLGLLYVPASESIFDDVEELRPGELLLAAGDRIETRRYYELRPPAGVSGGQSASGLEERFIGVMREAVKAHLISDVPLGLFLSGGLDSGMLLALMRAVISGPIKTFTLGYEDAADQGFDELAAAQYLAERFETDHTAERLRPDVVRLLPQIVRAMGEPLADSSAIPTYLVSAVARRAVTVALGGIGGDELFGGYPRYLGIEAAARYARVPRPMRAWIASSVAPRLGEGDGGRDQRGRAKRFFLHGHAPLAEQYRRWMTFLPNDWGMTAFTPEFEEAISEQRLGAGLITAFDRWASTVPADRAMGCDLQTYLPDDLLKMGDRLSSAHSLELRVPFCDHLVLQFALQIPAAIRLTGWRLKGFMRKALQPVLPGEVLARPKLGFSVPLARWLREELQVMVRDLLTEDRIRRRGYVKPEYVTWLIEEHQTGRRNLADPLYALLVLELWQQELDAGGLG